MGPIALHPIETHVCQSETDLTVLVTSTEVVSPKRLLGGVHDVQEAVLVLLLLVHLGDGRGVAHHAAIVDHQVKRLGRVQLQSPSVGRKRNRQFTVTTQWCKE